MKVLIRIIRFFTQFIKRSNRHKYSEPELFSRVEKVKGFSLEIMKKSHVICVGIGGIGSWIPVLLAKSGTGTISIVDPDDIEPSNISKTLFSINDISKPKVTILKREIQKQSPLPIKVNTEKTWFHNVPQSFSTHPPSLYAAAPDNNKARNDVSDIARKQRIPALFVGASEDGEMGYVFLQMPGQACFRCFMTSSQLGAMPCAPANSARFVILAGTLVDAAWQILCGINIKWNRALYNFKGTVEFNRLIPRQNCICQGERK